VTKWSALDWANRASRSVAKIWKSTIKLPVLCREMSLILTLCLPLRICTRLAIAAAGASATGPTRRGGAGGDRRRGAAGPFWGSPPAAPASCSGRRGTRPVPVRPGRLAVRVGRRRDWRRPRLPWRPAAKALPPSLAVGGAAGARVTARLPGPPRRRRGGSEGSSARARAGGGGRVRGGGVVGGERHGGGRRHRHQCGAPPRSLLPRVARSDCG